MESVIAVILGIALAASCGFRVFVPLLVAGVATRSGYLDVAPDFDWLGTWPALVAFSIASVAEIAAYYIPLIDNALDVIASPAAVIAGAILFAAVVVDMDPFFKWTMAVVAGGGSAAAVQGGTIVSRLASTGTTGGFANFVVNTLETAAGFTFSTLAIVVPVVALVALVLCVTMMYFAGRRVLRSFTSNQND